MNGTQEAPCQSTTFDLTLDALVDEDGERRDLTLYSIDLIDKAVAQGHPDAYILRAIRYQCPIDNGAKYYHLAESQGSTHPLLYYGLGNCYEEGDQDIHNTARAIAYYEKAIGGMFASPYLVLLGFH